MSDFIREVNEEVRRDRVTRFLSRSWPLLALLAVAIVAGAGFWRFYSDRQVRLAEAANARYDAAAALARDNHGEQAESAFATLANEAPAGYALLARMRAIALQAPGDPEGAAKAFDALANDDAVSPAMRAVARLRGAYLRVDHDDPKAFESRYGRFSTGDFPFHDSMRELLALAALKRDDGTAATRYLTEILGDPLTPAALRSRAGAFEALAAAGSVTTTATPAPSMTVTPAAAAVKQAGSPSTSPPSPSASPQPPAEPAPPGAQPAR